MADTAINFLMSLVVFCACIGAGCFIGASVSYSSRWWKYVQHIMPVSTVVGFILGVATYCWLS